MVEDLFVRELSAEQGWVQHSTGASGALREMEARDVGVLYEVYRDAFSSRPGIKLSEEMWTTKWPRHPQCIPRFSTVAVAGGGPVGYVLGYLDPATPKEGYIGQLGVKRDWQRKGIGTQMILRTMHAFRLAGFSSVALRVARDNLLAISLYRQLGFSRRA
jgi:ribosomal protein S18 acetylase RimI-like enzyme